MAAVAEIEIAVTHAPGATAPAGVWLTAVGAEGGAQGAHAPAHDRTYSWTIKGAPLNPYRAPGNMIPAWRDANRAWGPQVAFVLPKPGRYTIELTAIDPTGARAEARAEITIADPDEIYRDRRTIYVSTDPAERWTEVPDTALKVTSLAALQRLIDTARSPVRLLFRRGQTYAGLSLAIGRGPLTHIGAWGAGARPILAAAPTTPVFRFTRRAALDAVTIADLDFRGGWNPTTETGISSTSPFLWRDMSQAAFYTIWNCDISGVSRIDTAVFDHPSTIVLGDCKVTNWRDYGFLLRSANARFALVGCQVAQHPEALHGGGKIGEMSNNHGPLRVADCAAVYLGACDLFSRTGWSGLAGERADQPCLRLNTAGRAGMSITLDRLVAEGGAQVIGIAANSRNRPIYAGDYVIDKALLIGTAKTIGPFIGVTYGALTLRNVIGLLPDTPRKHPNRWRGAMLFGTTTTEPGSVDTKIRVYSSTFVSFLTGSNARDLGWRLAGGTEGFADIAVENCMSSAPGHQVPVHADGPLDLSANVPGIQPRFAGVRYNFEPQTGEMPDRVPPRGSLLLRYGAITRDTVLTQGTAATDQAYWEGRGPGQGAHILVVGRRSYLAVLGQIEVRFETDAVRIINLSGRVWDSGAAWALRLDRHRLIPPLDRRFASPGAVAQPRPTPDAVTHATAGWVAVDDFFGRTRPQPATKGAIDIG